MCEIIQFPRREIDTMSDDIFLDGVPPAPDPFPHFQMWMGSGRALMEAHVSGALADAMVEAVKASSDPVSFEIYKRDESTAWIDGCVPTAVAVTLLEMLAA